LAIAQAIDRLTKQVKRVIDTEMPPESKDGKAGWEDFNS